MSRYLFETAYGITVSNLLISNAPRTATLTFAEGKSTHEITFVAPRPLAATTKIMDGCYQIRVAEQEIAGQRVEVTRLKVELWDEDICYADFTIDSFEQAVTNV